MATINAEGIGATLNRKGSQIMSVSTPSGQVVKLTKSINVAVADEDIASVDKRIEQIAPFKPSRSELARLALRFTLHSLQSGDISMESLAQKFAESPVIDDGE